MSWLTFWRRRRFAEAEFDTEIRFHLEKLIEEKVAAGVPPEHARREALLEFGGREQVKETLRDVQRLPALESSIANLRSAVRFIRKWPSFSAAVVLTLALGVGANTAVFSAINAILLRPLPFPNADELMVVQQSERKAKVPNSFVAPTRLEDWNRLNTTFQTISGYYTEDASETSGALPEKVTEALVAPRFLQMWGVAPALGRDFTTAEEHFGGPNAALISDRFWRRRFHADASAIGKRLRLEHWSYTIVGVMPASFLFPDHDVDVWTTSPPDAPFAQSRESTWFIVMGRLKPGVTVEQARGNLNTVQAQLGRQYPKTDADLIVKVQPLKDTSVGAVRRSLWLLFGSVSLLLLIACTNIAALLLARTTEREREIAIRFSLGASRVSLITQLLTESFVLALGGSAAGLLFAAAATQWLRNLSKSLPRAEEISLDWHILAYTLACAVVATLLCGLVPAWRGTRRSIAGDLAHTGRTQVSARNPLQWMLVCVQVAFAVTLLVGAGLLLRSFQELGRVSAGFDMSNVLTFRISGNWGETADMKKLRHRISNTLEELRATPGVTAAAISATFPGVPSDSQTELSIMEGGSDKEHKIMADSRFISDGYFRVMRIPLLTGVDCRDSGNYDKVIVNRSFASKYLGDAPAVGHHIKLNTNFFVSAAEIQGVVGDAREQGLNREPGPTVYWCVFAPTPSPNFLVRTQGDSMRMADAIRHKIQQIEPARSVYNVSPLAEHLSDTFAETRLRTLLLTLFALTAVSLACIGLYGTLSYFVAIRRREVGLRLALGALRGQIVKRYLVQGIGVASLGCLAGLLLALGFSNALSGMLYGVSRVDPQTFAGVLILIVVVASLASFLPAMRAARVDPIEVLRDE